MKSIFANIEVEQEQLVNGLNITVLDLRSLITNSELKPGQTYNITDTQEGGIIQLQAITAFSISTVGSWHKQRNWKAFSFFRLAGSAGSVNQITSDLTGQNLLTATIPYTSSIANTLILVQNNINAGTGINHNFRAIAVRDVLIIEWLTVNNNINTTNLTVNTTTLTVSNKINFTGGGDPTIFENLSVEYSIIFDRVSCCRDSNNNEYKYSVFNYAGASNLANFRWNDPSYKNNLIVNTTFRNNFVVDTTFGFSGNLFFDGCTVENNIAEGTSYFYGNQFIGAARFTGNFCLGLSTITYNSVLTGTGSGATIGITNNTLNGQNLVNTTINGNTLIGRSCGIDANNLTGTASGQTVSIRDNILERGSTISSNNLTASATGQAIINNNVVRTGTTITTNTISANAASQGISTNNGVTIQNNTITNCVINACFGFGGGVIRNCTLNAASLTNIQFINTGTIGYPSSPYSYGFFEGFTISNRNNQNIQISSDEWIIRRRITLNGTANAGLIDSAIFLGITPAKFFNVSVEFEGNGLVGAGAFLQLGLQDGFANQGFGPTAISSLNTFINSPVASTAKSSLTRDYVAVPTGASITAGTISVTIRGKLGI